MNEKINSDNKLMSLISHLAVIWITQKDKSKFVRFNAIQAIFFQLVFFILIMLSIFVGLILMFVSIPLMNASPNGEPGVLFWVSMGIMNLYFPLWFFFSIYAIVAAVKSHKGKIFRYLIIGKIIEKRVYK